MKDFDRAFIRGVYDRCEGSLDLAVDGEEVGQALGLDEAQTADVVARLMRTGFVRDVAAPFRIKITARGIAVARLEPPSIAALPLPGSDVSLAGAWPTHGGIRHPRQRERLLEQEVQAELGWWGWVFLMNLPIVLIALVAVVALVPESRAAKRPAVDFVGVLLSSVGLGALMYAVVQAGADGLGSSSAIVPAAVGLLVLAAFVLWENRLMTRPGGEPLVNLSVFRSSRFTWGVILTAFGVFGLFGVMFALPQYMTAVMGLDAQGSGFRLLPLIGGLIVGAVPADRIAARVGAKITVTAGFAVMVAALAVGTTMAATSGDAFIAAWTFFAGIGSGLAFATAATAAIVELSPEHSGIGSAVLQVFVKLGPALGGSILGSVLNSTYQAQVNLAGLPAQAAAAVKSSAFAGIAVAGQLHSSALLASVQTAFVAGMDDAVRFAAGVGVVRAGAASASDGPASPRSSRP